MFLGALVPFAAYTWLSMTAGGDAGASYDAWILPVFPVLFCFMSKAVFEITDWISGMLNGNMKKVFMILIGIILIWGFYGQIQFADSTIKTKEPSYYNLKPAGEWIKENTAKEDKIYSAAIPELTYYSEREIVGHDDPVTNGTQSGFLKMLKENKVKYFVLTSWERSPDWIYSLPDENKLNLTVVQVYFLDKEMKNPDVIIYRIDW